jgi:hypothetical protein
MHDPMQHCGTKKITLHPDAPDYEIYVVGFKAMRSDMRCRNKQYAPHTTYTEDGELSICKHGMHYCLTIGDIFQYYSPSFDKDGNLNIRIFKVRAEGDIVAEVDQLTDTCKCAALTLRIEDEVPQDYLIAHYNIKSQQVTTFSYYDIAPKNQSFADLYMSKLPNYYIPMFVDGESPYYTLNAGANNLGTSNKGYRNVGSDNEGNNNAGCRNCGNQNAGNYNSGNCNIFDYNIGSYNIGYYNLGIRNIGDYNCGDCNIGNFNRTDCAIGYFNTQSGTHIMFNKPYQDARLPHDWMDLLNILNLIMRKAVAAAYQENPDIIEDIFTAENYTIWNDPNEYKMLIQQRESRIFEKLSSYRTEAFRKLSAENKQRIEALPNFDRKIFAECTGIAETAFDD